VPTDDYHVHMMEIPQEVRRLRVVGGKVTRQLL
jgi:hypothetical protein